MRAPTYYLNGVEEGGYHRPTKMMQGSIGGDQVENVLSLPVVRWVAKNAVASAALRSHISSCTTENGAMFKSIIIVIERKY